MKTKRHHAPVSSVNLDQQETKISVNYYFTIIVLVVVMLNLALMLYFKPA
jgi:hypothetical protein